MFLSVLHTSFNTPALNCPPLCALGYSNFLHFIPILSVKWALCVEYSMSFGVCSHYHRHWKGTCNLQKYNPFVPATSYWHFMISSEFQFHFKMIRSSVQNEWIWIDLYWLYIQEPTHLNFGLNVLISSQIGWAKMNSLYLLDLVFMV